MDSSNFVTLFNIEYIIDFDPRSDLRFHLPQSQRWFILQYILSRVGWKLLVTSSPLTAMGHSSKGRVVTPDEHQDTRHWKNMQAFNLHPADATFKEHTFQILSGSVILF